MKSEIKIGIIGLGGRGYGLLHTILNIEGIVVKAVCDNYEDRQERAVKFVEEKAGNTPLSTSDYKDILAMDEVEAVIVSSSWADHIHIAIDAMKAGKYVGVEVGGAYSIDECWELIRAYEETGVPCMMLENCCYGRKELMVLNMVKKGIMGEIVHCEGGYRHDLRDEIVHGRENRHYRLINYMNRNCDNYPTHQLGPIAKILNVNRGNRMLSLVSMASKARGLNEFIKKSEGEDYDLADYQFAQGDVVTTIIKCAHGETITLTMDTSLPRFYSRGFVVQGTKGMYQEDNHSIFLDELHGTEDEFSWKKNWNNADELREEYDHPIWKNYNPDENAGHGGMDDLVLSAFFDSVRRNVIPPIDVYDMAAWMCITALSEQSISMGGAPVAIPDFTNGRWINREPGHEGYFSLDKVE
ncbi:MAG: Gfo/Idh/MocA family oxidoreductase [Clostridiales bacterium]|nr:Gfo/Idh/MocA family oxidoreductase [Clostridiales bacterium]